MGTYAQTKGYALFDTFENKQLALEAWNKWNTENTSEGCDNSAKVESTADYPLALDFSAESDRDVNLVWRMEQLFELVKPFGLVEFEAPILIESESSLYWNKEDEEAEQEGSPS